VFRAHVRSPRNSGLSEISGRADHLGNLAAALQGLVIFKCDVNVVFGCEGHRWRALRVWASPVRFSVVSGVWGLWQARFPREHFWGLGEAVDHPGC
jgi:hypothetical protein